MNARSFSNLPHVQDFLAKLTSVRDAGRDQWMASCPGPNHENGDRNPSLSVTVAPDGRLLLNCHAGCTAEAVVGSMRLQMKDLFPKRDEFRATGRKPTTTQPNTRPPKKIHPTLDKAISAALWSVEQNAKVDKGTVIVGGQWQYDRAHGQPAMWVVRFNLPDESKQFRPIHPVEEGFRLGDPEGPLPLYLLPELDPAGVVYVVEGEKCVEAGRSISLNATTSAHGAKSPNKTDWTPLAGREVVLTPDHDSAGGGYVEKVAKILQKLEPPAVVRVIDLPGLGEGDDIVEFIEQRRKVDGLDDAVIADEIREIARLTDPLPERSANDGHDDPQHHQRKEARAKACASASARDASQYLLVPGPHATDAGELLEIGSSHFARAAIGRLPIDQLYRRGGIAGEIVGAAGSRVFRPVTTDDTRMLIDGNLKLGRWIQMGKGANAFQQLEFAACNKDHGGLVLARAGTDPRIREAKMLTTYPVFGPNFTLARPGWHDGIYYDEPAELRGLTPQTELDVVHATFDDLLIDFPWKDEASRQNFISLLLTPFIAPALEGNRPLALIIASLERTGKSKLAEEVFGGIVIGRPTPAMQTPKSEEEMDKRIISALLKGDSCIHLDNVREELDSASLCSLVTGAVYRGRVLGSSKLVDLPNNLTLIGTGNNIKATGEIVKRSMPIMLQPRTDAPELRKDFVHPDLWQFIKASRRLVVECLLGMVTSWLHAGKPRGQIPMGGFDQWAAVTGGIMGLYGFDQWMTNAVAWRQASDPRRSDLQELVREWYRVYQTQMATAKDLLEIAVRLELFPDVINPDKTDKSNQTAFGMRILSRHDETPVDQWVIRKSDLSRPATYYLRPVVRSGE